MSNQENKLTDMLDKLDHIIKQLQKRVKSQNTEAHDGPTDYEYHEGYRHHLLDKLHNLCQGDSSVRDYIVKIENLTYRCDMGEHCSLIIIRFILVYGLTLGML